MLLGAPIPGVSRKILIAGLAVSTYAAPLGLRLIGDHGWIQHGVEHGAQPLQETAWRLRLPTSRVNSPTCNDVTCTDLSKSGSRPLHIHDVYYVLEIRVASSACSVVSSLIIAAAAWSYLLIICAAGNAPEPGRIRSRLWVRHNGRDLVRESYRPETKYHPSCNNHADAKSLSPIRAEKAHRKGKSWDSGCPICPLRS